MKILRVVNFCESNSNGFQQVEFTKQEDGMCMTMTGEEDGNRYQADIMFTKQEDFSDLLQFIDDCMPNKNEPELIFRDPKTGKVIS